MATRPTLRPTGGITASRPRRHASRLACRLGAGLGLSLLAACAASGEPPGPLLVGGRLAADLDMLAPPDVVGIDLSPRVVTTVEEVRAHPGSGAPPWPPPRKPGAPARLVWLPTFKPLPRSSIAVAWNVPHPAPAKPLDAVEPAAGPTAPPPRPPPAKPTPPVAPGAAPVGTRTTDQLRDPLSAVRIARGHGATAAADAVAVDSDDAGLAALAMAAREALLAGDAATALDLYDQLATIMPLQRTALLGRAIALSQLGHQREAQVVYRALLEADPDDLTARTAYLGLLTEVAPEGALAELRTLARRHGEDSQLLAQIALAEAGRGDLGQAAATMLRAVAADPMNPRHQMNLAVLYDRLGQAVPAIDHYRKALAMAMRSGDPTLPLDAIEARLRHLSHRSG